jgi:phytanoyl-CoA hydroxylase
VTYEQAERDGYFLVEDLVSAADCVRFADRLQQYARGGTLPAGLSLQREPALDNGNGPRADGGDIRKISGLYGDDLFRSLIQRDDITNRLRPLIGSELRLFRADALMKPPAVGSEKGVHQDSPYWPIQPMSLWSCWIPFDDATIENGCMMVIPGSHQIGPQRHVHEDDYVIPTDDYDVDALRAVPMRGVAACSFTACSFTPPRRTPQRSRGAR